MHLKPLDRAVKDLEISSRRLKVAELYLRGGSTQQSIATAIGMSRQTVAMDLAAVRAEWKQERLDRVDEAVNEELQRLALLEREAWDAWERSKGESKRSRTSRTMGAGGEKTVASIDKIEVVGDPRFLDMVFRCIAKRSELLGLDAPKKVDVEVRREEKLARLKGIQQRYGLDALQLTGGR